MLDPDALLAALWRAAPEADLRGGQVIYASYKPQHSCRVTCRLNVGGAEIDLGVRACRREDMARWFDVAGAMADMPSPLVPGRIVLEDCAVVVTVFPDDLRIKSLPRLADAAKRKPLLREMLPDSPGLWDAEPHCLRYRPERRFVARLQAEDGSLALLKCCARRTYAPAMNNARAFESGGLLRIPRLLGGSDDLHLLVFEWMPGRLLFDICAAPALDYEAVTAAGTALAALHAQQPAGLRRWTREAETNDLFSRAAAIGFICPNLARRANELAGRLASKLADAPPMNCALHGDFSADQVLVGPEAVAIVDMDDACMGDPAGDLGNILAQAERSVLRGEFPLGRVELLKELLLKGYARAANGSLPERIEIYTAVGVFRRARFPFHTREQDWPRRTEVLLERVEAILNATRPRPQSGRRWV